MSLFLSRAVLRRDASFAALAPLLIPSEDDARTGAAHHLVWSLFADGKDRKRDFLWHEEAPGTFLVLSSRPPGDPRALFDLDIRPFAPQLSAGDRLSFFLRVNAVVTSGTPNEKGRRPRHDVVMAAISARPGGTRADARAEALGWAGEASAEDPTPVAWLRRQGERNGFTVDGAAVLAYRQLRLPRDTAEGKQSILAFSTVDLEGALAVAEPASFLAALRRGFGKAKAFGCGLMLIRRA